MPRSAFAFPGDELCGALQGGIAYLVMWTQGAEAQATSTAIALDQRIWTSLWSHTQVRHKNTPAYIRRCAHACAHEGYFDWKKRKGFTVSIKWSAFQESSSVPQAPGRQNRTFCGTLPGVSPLDSLSLRWWNGSRCPTPKQGIEVLPSYKELFKNNPQAEIQTMLLCTTRFASVAFTLVPRQLWPVGARVFMGVLCRINRCHLPSRTFEPIYLKANA